MIRKACNKFVLIFRDETKSEDGGFELPSDGREKPHVGTIHVVGSLVEDKELEKAIGQKCLFHPTVGWNIEYEGKTYLVLSGHEIIAIP